MNTDDPQFELIRRCRDGEASAEEFAQLESHLRDDAGFREAYVHYANLDFALSDIARTGSIPATTNKLKPVRRNAWLAWRPMSAAVAGVMFGIFCTSLVYGFVAQHVDEVNQIAMEVFDRGFEDNHQTLASGIPKAPGQWGADSAALVGRKSDVAPNEGKQMLRLNPIPRDKDVKSFSSRVYQVLDLSSLPPTGLLGDALVKVSASFYPTSSDVSSRYLIRAIATNEAPDTAMKDFWSKTENDEVVSMSQRFDVMPGESQWHTFELKMPLPSGARTLVVVFGAASPLEESEEGIVHYMDDVQVSLLTSPGL